MNKYPIYTLELEKSEIKQKSVLEIIEYYKQKIQQHKIAKFIAIFDHYEHTKSLDGEINPDIKDAKNIIFCFGAAIPNTTILAARPRSISVSEMENSFFIEFIEAPKEKIHEVMESWTKSLKQ